MSLKSRLLAHKNRTPDSVRHARRLEPEVPGSPQATPNVAGSPLRGHIDAPLPHDIVGRDAVVVRGWHLWEDQPALAVAIEVDGRVVGHVATGTESRPDVARALGVERFADGGWQGIIDLSGQKDDEIVMTVSVWPAPGLPAVVLEPIGVRLTSDHGHRQRSTGPNRFHGAFDLPPTGKPVVRGPMNLVGWALTDRSPASRVEITVNGKSVGPARIGLDRPDVARHHRAAHAEVSGFECLVDLSSLPAGANSVAVEAVTTSLEGITKVTAKRRYRLTPPRSTPGRAARAAVLKRRFKEIAATQAPDSGLNLVVFTHDLGYGGGQLWLSELLRRSGAGTAFPTTVVSPSAGPLLEEFEEAGMEVHVTQSAPLTDIEAYEGRMLETAAWLAARSHNAALVNTFGSFAGADAATRLGLATVWAIHESWAPSLFWSVAYPPDFVHPDIRQAAVQALGATGAVIFEAQQTRQQYLSATAKDRSVVVPYGIDTGVIDRYRAQTTKTEARRAVNLPPDARVLLVMGTTERRKAQTVLAEAFARIARDYPDAMLVFVGDTGTPYAEALARLLRRAGVAGQTRLLPVVEDTYQWYRASDVLVCGSDVESLPRSVLESMAFGLPVLATSVFGLADLIDDGRTGFLFEPLDLSGAVAALRRVLDLDPAALATVAEAGRQLVLSEHDSAGYSADVLALLEGLGADGSALPGEILAKRGRSSPTVD